MLTPSPTARGASRFSVALAAEARSSLLKGVVGVFAVGSR
jgi:hypothetical protein